MKKDIGFKLDECSRYQKAELLDLTSQLFDSVVLPVLMYGGEVLAAYPSTEIEKVCILNSVNTY